MAEAAQQTTIKIPSAPTLKRTHQSLSALSAVMDSKRGEIGALMKDFEDTHNGNRAAMKLAHKIMTMESAKAQAFMRDLLLYLEGLGFRNQGDMFNPVPGPEYVLGEPDAPADPPAEPTTVVQMPTRAPARGRKKAEKATTPETPPAAETAPADPTEGPTGDELDNVAIEEEGRAACRIGREAKDNPYDEEDETEQREAWAQGWQAASREGEFATTKHEEVARRPLHIR